MGRQTAAASEKEQQNVMDKRISRENILMDKRRNIFISLRSVVVASLGLANGSIWDVSISWCFLCLSPTGPERSMGHFGDLSHNNLTAVNLFSVAGDDSIYGVRAVFAQFFPHQVVRCWEMEMTFQTTAFLSQATGRLDHISEHS